MVCREFPDSPVVRAWGFHYWGPGLILGWETNISQASNVAKKNCNFFPNHVSFLLPHTGAGRRGKWTTSQLTDWWERSKQTEKTKVKRAQKAEVETRWQDDPRWNSSVVSPLSVLNTPPLSGVAASYWLLMVLEQGYLTGAGEKGGHNSPVRPGCSLSPGHM